MSTQPNNNNDNDNDNLGTNAKTTETRIAYREINEYDTFQDYPSMSIFCQSLLQKYGFTKEQYHPAESTTKEMQQQPSLLLDTDIPPASQSGREAANTLTTLASSIM